MFAELKKNLYLCTTQRKQWGRTLKWCRVQFVNNDSTALQYSGNNLVTTILSGSRRITDGATILQGAVVFSESANDCDTMFSNFVMI